MIWAAFLGDGQEGQQWCSVLHWYKNNYSVRAMPEEQIKQQMRLTLPLPPVQPRCEASLLSPDSAASSARLSAGPQTLPAYLPSAGHRASAPACKEFTELFLTGMWLRVKLGSALPRLGQGAPALACEGSSLCLFPLAGCV